MIIVQMPACNVRHCDIKGIILYFLVSSNFLQCIIQLFLHVEGILSYKANSPLQRELLPPKENSSPELPPHIWSLIDSLATIYLSSSTAKCCRTEMWVVAELHVQCEIYLTLVCSNVLVIQIQVSANLLANVIVLDGFACQQLPPLPNIC